MINDNTFQVKLLHQLICPKQGEDIEDCQDALDVNLEINRFAVADGVSRSFYPALFSKQLTQFFCSANDSVNLELFHHGDWKKWLEISQKNWIENVQEIVKHTHKYYIKNRFYNNEPAGSTFAGIEFYQNENQSIFWNAMIIGDSCIIHFDKACQKSNKYLIQSSKDFNFTPSYFPSRPIVDNPFKPSFIIDQTVSIDDVFIIATDAISKWILMLMETSQTHLLSDIHNISYQMIDQFRSDDALENDDIALLVIKIVKPAT